MDAIEVIQANALGGQRHIQTIKDLIREKFGIFADPALSAIDPELADLLQRFGAIFDDAETLKSADPPA